MQDNKAGDAQTHVPHTKPTHAVMPQGIHPRRDFAVEFVKKYMHLFVDLG